MPTDKWNDWNVEAKTHLNKAKAGNMSLEDFEIWLGLRKKGV